MFLNSAKVDVAAGATEEVTITIPTKYLASYDYTNAKTYILDEGDYYFTAAAGSHEAVNNILAAQGYTTADGMDSDLIRQTFSTSSLKILQIRSGQSLSDRSRSMRQ